MWKWAWLLLALIAWSCGYKTVGWSSGRYATLAIEPVKSQLESWGLRVRLRDALIERCLAGSTLRPTDETGDLRLQSEILEYSESIIATGADGRTSRLQFTLRANFTLLDREGQRLWGLENYQFSDQYNISITANEYRDEAVFVQDNAFRTISDLVITNITLAISELERALE